MTRCHASDRSLPVRLLLGFYRACASLQLAVVLIVGCAVVLAWATFVEKYFGTPAVHFGIYGAWWFSALNAALALNVLCSALIRFPWKRRQIGFLVTHSGIIVLLFGCLMTRWAGIDAMLSVFEGQSQWRAYTEEQDLVLTIHRDEDESQSEGESDSDSKSKSKPEPILIPFCAGPFNWRDYGTVRSFFPWGLARRDTGVVYDRDGVKLEVLDYYGDSRQVAVPWVDLQVTRTGKEGESSAESAGESIELSGVAMGGAHGAGMRGPEGGPRLTFWMASSEAETAAFRDSGPEGSLGPEGQIVLHAAGRKFAVGMKAFQQQPRRPLGETGFEVELPEHRAGAAALTLRLYYRDEPVGELTLWSDFPDRNRQAASHGVFGTYWRPPPKAGDPSRYSPEMARILEQIQWPRIDVLQGTDQRLYYRAWRLPRLTETGRFRSGKDAKIAVFEGTDDAVNVSINEFYPGERPDWKVLPVDFNKDKSAKRRRVQLKLTVDGCSEKFWLEGLRWSWQEVEEGSVYRKVVRGIDRRASVCLAYAEVDVGFRVHLHEFKLKRDPGSKEPSDYSSLVDFCDREDLEKKLQEKVWITMNVPATFADPKTGRSYRLYQSSYLKVPLKPGDAGFEQMVDGREMRDLLNRTDLSVNYDPGRGMKYVGSLLICVGILIMFYMKAYFFGRKRDKKTAS